MSSDLAMPFITVRSKGGPHDDESYAAGFEMGALDASLELLGRQPPGPHWPVNWPVPRSSTPVEWGMTIHTENVPQADLIAMRHGYTMQTQLTEEPAWTVAVFRKAQDQ